MTLTSDLFRPAVLIHDGSTLRAFCIKCGHCGHEEKTRANTMKGTSDDRERQIMIAKFCKQGWKVGQSPGAHRCPGCFAAAKNARKKTAERENMVQLKSAETVRTMQIEDRRIVVAKLVDSWKGDRYKDGWSDQKIADDLGVPRAWVKQLREENFGADGSSEQLVAQIAEANALIARVNSIGPRADEIVAQCRKLVDEAERISRQLASIERTLR